MRFPPRVALWIGIAGTVAAGALMGLGFQIGQDDATSAWPMLPLIAGIALAFFTAFVIARSGGHWVLALGSMWITVGIGGLLAGPLWALAVWFVPGLGCAVYALWRMRADAQWRRRGRPATATVLAAEQTSTVINNVMSVWRTRLRIEPGDGTAAFEADKRITLPMYRHLTAGDTLEVLVDPARPGEFFLP